MRISALPNYAYNNIRTNQGFSTPAKNDKISFSGRSMKNITKIFEDYNPVIKKFAGYSLHVHNTKIADNLQSAYTTESFQRLFKLADENGVFNLHYNEQTGFFKTSLVCAKHDNLMANLVWVTDTCNYMPVLKDKYPDKAVPIMEKISHYYKTQETAINKVIKNPILYKFNRLWAAFSKNGTGHVFNPKNYKTHKWYPRTRLESVGLYLQTVSDLVKEGFNGANYGYKKASDISDKTVDAIANLTKYIKTINYPYAKSTNSWEEHTFRCTATSDTAILNQALRKIMDLMYGETSNKEIQILRDRIKSSKNGDVFLDKTALETLLKRGEYRIRHDNMSEAFDQRKHDAALSFVAQSENYSHNIIKDINENVKRLMSLEQGDTTHKPLVRNNGIVRYNKDQYLYLNSNIVKNKNYMPPDMEAEWFLVTEISKGYGTQLKKLLNHIEKKNGNITQEEKELKDFLLSKQTEYINRGYARITGADSFKADCVPCNEWLVPEAYQAVSSRKGVKCVPGDNSPLAWAQSSLYSASKALQENLQKLGI